MSISEIVINTLSIILQYIVVNKCSRTTRSGFMWDIIEKLMKDKNLTQYKLSKLMNVHQSVISGLKLGKIGKPSFELACKLADALEVSLDDLRSDKNGAD